MNAIYILSGLGVASLLSEIFNFKKFILYIALVGLLAAIGFTLADWNTNVKYFNDMVHFDNYAIAFTAVLTTITFLWLLVFRKFFNPHYHFTDHVSLVLFALVGAVLLVSYSNMVMLFIGIEILSLSLYVLAGSRKGDLLSNEAALKYFLLGSFMSGFLLFGMALIYAASGSFNLTEIFAYSLSGDVKPFYYVGILMIMAAMAFKISAAPFHFWAPDVYQGSPTAVTAFMASVVKTAAVAGLFRLFATSFIVDNEVWVPALSAIAILTLAVSNIIAIQQQEAKRLFAYSSISHAGFLLIAMVSLENSAIAILYYGLAYSLATILTFYVVDRVQDATGNLEVSGFKGLLYKNPVLAVALLISMLSLAGIPPMAGFFGKYYIFVGAIKGGKLWLAIAGILASMVSIYYYLKVLSFAFLQKEEETENTQKISIPAFNSFIVILISIAIVVLGAFPDLIFKLLEK